MDQTCGFPIEIVTNVTSVAFSIMNVHECSTNLSKTEGEIRLLRRDLKAPTPPPHTIWYRDNRARLS